MENVIRGMAKEMVKDATNRIVNQYLNKRFRSKTEDEFDPMRMVANSLLESAMKSILKGLVKDNMSGLTFEYLIEAQFESLFKNYYIRKAVRETAEDTIDEVAIGLVIEDYLDRIIKEAVPVIAQQEIEGEKKRLEKLELRYAFSEYVDRATLQIMIDGMCKMYEEEERELHIREQNDKARRVSSSDTLLSIG